MLFLLRILFGVLLAWLLWFQPNPWLDFKDWEATDREYMSQRIQQGAYFLTFMAAFGILGFLHTKISLNSTGVSNPSQKRRNLEIIVAFGLAICLAVKSFGLFRPGNGTLGGICIVSTVAVMLFECARRVVRVERGAFVGFAVVTSAVPLILFWPQLN